MTAMQLAYGRAIIKRMVRRHKELKKKATIPLYDNIFFEGLKWLDSL